MSTRRVAALGTALLLWAVLGLGVLWAVLWLQASDPPAVVSVDTDTFPGLLRAATVGTVATLGLGLVAAAVWWTRPQWSAWALAAVAAGVAVAAPGWETYPDAALLYPASLLGIAAPLALLSLAGLRGRAPTAADAGLLRSAPWRIVASSVVVAALGAAILAAVDGLGIPLVHGNAEEEDGWPYVFFPTVVAVVLAFLLGAFLRGAPRSPSGSRPG